MPEGKAPLDLEKMLIGSPFERQAECITRVLEQRGINIQADLEAAVAGGNVCGQNIYVVVDYLLHWEPQPEADGAVYVGPEVEAEADADADAPDVSVVDGVGPKIKEKLNKLRIYTAADLAAADQEVLGEAGITNAATLIEAAKEVTSYA